MPTYHGAPPSGDPFTDRRRTGIGGSDAGAILGVSPWASALSVWEEKRGIAVEPWDPDGVPERVKWGSRLETAILDGYAEDTGRKVRRTGRKHRRSKVYPWVVGHPDGETDDRLLEVKTTSHLSDQWGEDGSEDIPAHYYCQVQHYLVLTGHQRADVIVLVGGRELHIYTIDANRRFQDEMLKEELRFWQMVESGTPPEPDGSESAGKALRAMFPVAIPEEMVATPALNIAAADYVEAKGERDAADLRMSRATQQMQAALGHRDVLVGNGWRAKWSNVAGRVSPTAKAEAIHGGWRDLLIPHYSDDALDDIQQRIERNATEAARGEPSRMFRFTKKRGEE